MLNIKYDSNYKNVVNKIIEELNEKLKTYLIFDGDIINAIKNRDLNIDGLELWIERNPSEYRTPYHLFSYQDMCLILDNKKCPQNYSIKVNNPKKYLYIELCVKKETMAEYNKFNQYEKEFAVNLLNRNGLYLEKINDINDQFFLVGIKKEKLEDKIDKDTLNLSKVKLEFKSQLENIANKIIKNINDKLINAKIYDHEKILINKFGKTEIMEDEDEIINKNTINLFSHKLMEERFEMMQWDKKYLNDEYHDKYLYAMLCIKKEITDEFEKLNNSEQELVNKLLYTRGIYLKKISTGAYSMIGINIDLIE